MFFELLTYNFHFVYIYYVDSLYEVELTTYITYAICYVHLCVQQKYTLYLYVR